MYLNYLLKYIIHTNLQMFYIICYLIGLDSVIIPYIKYFIDTDVNGQKLLDMQPNDLDKIGVQKIGHQELILEAVDLLRNFVSLNRYIKIA